MNNWIKSFVCLLSALILTLAGCGGKPPSVPEADELLAEYDSDKTMMIGAWGTVNHSYEAFKSAADMGLTHMFIDNSNGGAYAPGDPNAADPALRGSKDILELEEWCADLGLKTVWQSGVGTTNSNITVGNENWRNYECFDMINICDEPVWAVMDKLEQTVKAFDETFGDTFTCFTNLWPSSAAGSNIGANYTDYLEKHKQIIKQITRGRRIMSVDIYPLIDRNGAMSIDSSWLRNMYDVKAAAEDIDADFHIYIQSVGYTQHRRPTTKAEIGFQVWTDMCFGIDGYTYFTFAGDGSSDSWQYTPAVIHAKGEAGAQGKPYIQSYYDGCKEVNMEIRALDKVYQGFDWEGVMAVQGTLSETTDAGIFSLNKVKLSAEDVDFLEGFTATVPTVAGVYRRGEQGALMLSNYTDPKDSLTDEVEITFAEATHALVYYQGAWELITLDGNKLTMRLATGEGAFVLPYTFL